MGVKGQDAIACWGGLGSYVSRGEQRVSEMECHAARLRERLNRLETMLPPAVIEATIAKQKGEDPPDLLKLIGEEQTVEDMSNEPCKKNKLHLSEDDGLQLCVLQSLAKKEKTLRKQIYDMERKEEIYLKTLCETDKNLDDLIRSKRTPKDCRGQCPEADDPTISSQRNVQERISRLEAYNKQLSTNLQDLQKDRKQLTREAEVLSQELWDTRNGLGMVEEKVFGARSSGSDLPLDPIESDAEGNLRSSEKTPCPPCCKRNAENPKKRPSNARELRKLAGCFEEAFKKAEEEGLRPDERGRIRVTARKLKALSNAPFNECPCGEPVKCDSCTICTCAEWEEDLEGGGDDEPEEFSSRSASSKDRKIPTSKEDRCRCGCYETSSESECPCGCREVAREEICESCCHGTIDSTDDSDPLTITTTTIPSTVDNVVDDESEDERCCLCSAEQPCENRCEICKCEPALKSDSNKGNKCSICKCDESNVLRLSVKALRENHACECTVCADSETGGKLPPCTMCNSLLRTPSSTREQIDALNCACPPDVPPEVQRVCKVEKLREGLETLKNRNHALRKYLKSCECLPAIDPSSLAPDAESPEDCPCASFPGPVRRTTSGLISTVKLLQLKCRTKDGMIVALADELKRAGTTDQTDRILESLADPSLCCRANDFDRSELWKYLRLPEQRRRSYHGRVSGDPMKTRIVEPPRRLEVNPSHGRDVLIGLLVLFLILLSQLVRSYYDLSAAQDYLRATCDRIVRVYHSIAKWLLTSYTALSCLFETLRRESSSLMLRFSWTRDHLNAVSRYAGSLGALVGSLSFVRSTWCFFKVLFEKVFKVFFEKVFGCCYGSACCRTLRSILCNFVGKIAAVLGFLEYCLTRPVKLLLTSVFQSLMMSIKSFKCVVSTFTFPRCPRITVIVSEYFGHAWTVLRAFFVSSCKIARDSTLYLKNLLFCRRSPSPHVICIAVGFCANKMLSTASPFHRFVISSNATDIANRGNCAGDSNDGVFLFDLTQFIPAGLTNASEMVQAVVGKLTEFLSNPDAS